MKQKITMLVMDVDGTLTDGKIYMGNSGELMKVFDIKDGYAIVDILPKHSIIPVIITGRESKILESRCNELGISELHQGCTRKLDKMIEIANLYGLQRDENGKFVGCAYIGDDNIDIPCMELSIYSGCPSAASEDVKKTVSYICNRKGGDGAVREFIEWLLIKNEV